MYVLCWLCRLLTGEDISVVAKKDLEEDVFQLLQRKEDMEEDFVLLISMR